VLVLVLGSSMAAESPQALTRASAARRGRALRGRCIVGLVL